MDIKRTLTAIGAIFLIAWSGFVIAAYFVVQKPLAMQVVERLLELGWTLVVVFILSFNALTLGNFIVKRLVPGALEDDALPILACGIGLGGLGLLGFGFAAFGASDFPTLFAAQALLLAWSIWRGWAGEAIPHLEHLARQFKDSSSHIPAWMKVAGFTALVLTFLMALLPPMDAFDALLYHLVVPARWIADNGLRAYDFPHYWFPGLVEGVYFWALGLNTDMAPQHIHLVWAVATSLLLWEWSRRLWGNFTAWWTLTLLISMPSLLLLASWAYTDLALSFYGAAMLFTLWRGWESNDTHWWKISAVAAGMAMGVKYTSFVMPLTAVALIAVWKFREKKTMFRELFRFASISIVAGGIWYLRNWIWMGNPFYPFVFGGRYWDSFRAAWFAGAGTGSGWNLKALASLPLTITLGYQDANVFDGDIGPILLLSLPAFLLAMASVKKPEMKQRTALGIILLFAVASAGVWTYGYITTRYLWQTRLLLPALIPFTLPAAFGMTHIAAFDSARLRTSFIIASLAMLAIFTNLLDMGLSAIVRNPLGVATGIVSREEYARRFQPAFATALEMINQTPPDSKIYFLFEPRSYGASRDVQPDPILDNFSHDAYLHGTPENIVNAWRAEGFTHILVNWTGAEQVLGDRFEKTILTEVARQLKQASSSPDGTNELLEIPAP